jgi:hypothetical protein
MPNAQHHPKKAETGLKTSQEVCQSDRSTRALRISSDDIVPSMVSHAAHAMPRSASSFFNNADLCTLLLTLVDLDARSLLAFHSLTRASWNAVVYEIPPRKTLLLAPEPPQFQGILVTDSIRTGSTTVRQKYYFIRKVPYITHDKITPTQLATNWRFTWSDELQRRVDPLGQIITLHPAITSTFDFLSKGSYLSIRKGYDIFNAPQLHMDMFLTQPPQSVVEGRTKHTLKPWKALTFRIKVENGVRLRDMVAYFNSRKEETDCYFHTGYVAWEYRDAVSRDDDLARNARDNSLLRQTGETGLGKLYSYRHN